MTPERQPPELLLVHGSGRTRHFWDPLRAALGERLPLWTPDLPGRGGHGALQTVDALAKWLLGEIAARGRPVIVLGHSLGGAIALQCALDAGERSLVRGIVLVCTGARLRVHPLIREAVAEAARSGLRLPPPPGLYHRSTPAEAIARFETDEARAHPKAEQADWEACHTFDRLDAISRIALPALVVSGTEDTLTPPKYARALAERIPSARLVEIEGAGHMLPLERAEELAAAVRAFYPER